MAKKVKCRQCGNSLLQTDAYLYKTPQSSNMYYCSEEHFILHKGLDLFLAKVQEICEIKLYKNQKDKLSKVYESKGYYLCMEYLEEDAEFLRNLSNVKMFEIDHLNSYMATVIANRADKYKKREVKENKIVEVEYDDTTKYKRVNKRRALVDIERECGVNWNS